MYFFSCVLSVDAGIHWGILELLCCGWGEKTVFRITEAQSGVEALPGSE